MGFVGLSVPRPALPFMPCVEVGYRLARESWRQGIATEGAKAALGVGFGRLGLEEIVSFTALLNRPSQGAMQRIGLLDSQADFDHPALPEGHPLKRHCLFRMGRDRWLAGR